MYLQYNLRFIPEDPSLAMNSHVLFNTNISNIIAKLWIFHSIACRWYFSHVPSYTFIIPTVAYGMYCTSTRASMRSAWQPQWCRSEDVEKGRGGWIGKGKSRRAEIVDDCCGRWRGDDCARRRETVVVGSDGSNSILVFDKSLR